MSEPPRRVLFICTANMQRSPTAELVANHWFGDRIVAKSAGAVAGPRRVTQELIDWAEEIVTMEHWHQRLIAGGPFKNVPTLYCLEIPDYYEYRDPRLVQLLKDAIEHRLERGKWLPFGMTQSKGYNA